MTLADNLRSFDVSEPDIDQEVIVLCKDGSCYVAIYRKDYDDRDRWIVRGPAGAGRRLRKKVLWWMPRPQLPNMEGDNA